MLHKRFFHAGSPAFLAGKETLSVLDTVQAMRSVRNKPTHDAAQHAGAQRDTGTDARCSRLLAYRPRPGLIMRNGGNHVYLRLLAARTVGHFMAVAAGPQCPESCSRITCQKLVHQVAGSGSGGSGPCLLHACFGGQIEQWLLLEQLSDACLQHRHAITPNTPEFQQ